MNLLSILQNPTTETVETTKKKKKSSIWFLPRLAWASYAAFDSFTCWTRWLGILCICNIGLSMTKCQLPGTLSIAVMMGWYRKSMSPRWYRNRFCVRTQNVLKLSIILECSIILEVDAFGSRLLNRPLMYDLIIHLISHPLPFNLFLIAYKVWFRPVWMRGSNEEYSRVLTCVCNPLFLSLILTSHICMS